MKIIFDHKELSILKKIARKSVKAHLGYIQCLNSLAMASGYTSWNSLYKEIKS